jgi:hypothetical protein
MKKKTCFHENENVEKPIIGMAAILRFKNLLATDALE